MMYIMSAYPRWEEALKMCSQPYGTTMNGLVQCLPDVCMVIYIYHYIFVFSFLQYFTLCFFCHSLKCVSVSASFYVDLPVVCIHVCMCKTMGLNLENYVHVQFCFKLIPMVKMYILFLVFTKYCRM